MNFGMRHLGGVLAVAVVSVLFVAFALNSGDDVPTGGESLGTISTAENTLYYGHSFEDLQNNVRSGGVAQDGIPSIDDPEYIDAGESNLDSDEIVFGIEYEGEIKAYPQRILVSHEIVNDELGDEKVAMTYCPLTATAMGQKSGVEMGVSGNLVNSNLVMYDRDTESYWPQIMSTAISGEKQGESLEEFRVIWTTWDEWTEKHPDTEVLSSDTGFIRDYDTDPYGRFDYYESDDTMFPLMSENDTYHPKDMVLGYRNTEEAAAFDYDLLRDEQVVDAEIGGENYVMVYEEILDTGRLYANPDQLEVEHDNGEYTVEGESYEADNLPLNERPVFDAFWFAWSSFYPEADLYE